MSATLSAAQPLQTVWAVITGPPSAGKTSVIDRLASRGHPVLSETAREHIAALGMPAAEIAASRELQVDIQHAIARLQQARERELDPVRPVFLDRGMPDSIAYFRRLDIATDGLRLQAAALRYRHVFYLEGLPLARDGLRFEDEQEAAHIGKQIFDAYVLLGYAPIRVPAFADLPITEAVARRVDLILALTGFAAPNA